MKKTKKALIWYLMFSKRLLHKFSFIFLLCLIPAVIPLMNTVLSDDAGILKIVLCCEDDDPSSKKAIDTLQNSDGIIQYSVSHSKEQAMEAVRKFKADAAWIFRNNLSEAINQYALDESSDPLVHIIQREETVPLQISRELLHGALYGDIVYSVYSDFVKKNVLPENSVSDSQLREYYESTQRNGDIIKTERLNSSVPLMETNYLTAPLRGILALLIMLCTMAAALYFLKDQSEGKYDWLPPQKRLIPAFASCLSASVFSAVAVFVSFQFTGLTTGFCRDLLGMILYVCCTTGFCINLCTLFRSPGKLGATIPGLIIIMLVLSPIFFNGTELRPIRLCLPPYYYLQSTYNNDYYIYSLVYCIVAYGLAFVLNFIMNKKPSRIKIFR